MEQEMMRQVERFSENFSACSKMLRVIGDETRQHLILEMIKIGDCGGVRVGAITEKTNLSRPAVSHHLKIMKDAGLVSVRKEGTRNYYYFSPDMKTLSQLAETLRLAAEITKALPDRSGEELWQTRFAEQERTGRKRPNDGKQTQEGI